MLLQQSIEHVSIVYICYTYFVMHWSMLFIQESLVNVRIQYDTPLELTLPMLIHVLTTRT